MNLNVIYAAVLNGDRFLLLYTHFKSFPDDYGQKNNVKTTHDSVKIETVVVWTEMDQYNRFKMVAV